MYEQVAEFRPVRLQVPGRGRRASAGGRPPQVCQRDGESGSHAGQSSGRDRAAAQIHAADTNPASSTPAVAPRSA